MFERFLKGYKIYYRFRENFELYNIVKGSQFDTFLHSTEPTLYVTLAFSWNKTEQGTEFWEKIDKKWKSFYNQKRYM